MLLAVIEPDIANVLIDLVPPQIEVSLENDAISCKALFRLESVGMRYKGLCQISV